MRKAVVIIALGISLIVAGGIVTAMELTSWGPYDIEQNVADFKKETLSTEISFEELQTDRIIISNGYWIGFDFEDYLEGDEDYLDLDYDLEYYYGNRGYDSVNIKIDPNQTEGSIKVDYTYLAPFSGEECGLDSITYGKDNNRTEYRSHIDGRGNLRNQRNSRYNSKNQNRRHLEVEEDTTYIFPQCRDYYGWGVGYDSNGRFFNFGFTDELKAILKHKQIPVNMSKIEVTVNPEDSHRVFNR